METIRDNLNLANDPEIKKLIDKDGKLLKTFIERLLFSGKIHKFNPMNWKQERTMIITNKSIMNLKSKGKKY